MASSPATAVRLRRDRLMDVDHPLRHLKELHANAYFGLVLEDHVGVGAVPRQRSVPDPLRYCAYLCHRKRHDAIVLRRRGRSRSRLSRLRVPTPVHRHQAVVIPERARHELLVRTMHLVDPPEQAVAVWNLLDCPILFCGYRVRTSHNTRARVLPGGIAPRAISSPRSSP